MVFQSDEGKFVLKTPKDAPTVLGVDALVIGDLGMLRFFVDSTICLNFLISYHRASRKRDGCRPRPKLHRLGVQTVQA
jgi:hypothetical protein